MSIYIDFIDMIWPCVDMIDTSSERVAIAGNYRQMTFRPDRPFNDLPLLPPDRDLETRRVTTRRLAGAC